MKPNQFSPTDQEIENIKQRNKLLKPNDRMCYKCGHLPCEGCGNTWCDSMLPNLKYQGNWDGLDEDDVNKETGDVWPPHCCCDGECSY